MFDAGDRGAAGGGAGGVAGWTVVRRAAADLRAARVAAACSRAAAAGIADLAPGAGLAVLLQDVVLGSVSSGRVLDVVVAAERLVAWAQSRQAEAVAELARRPEMTPQPGPPPGRAVPLDAADVTAAEIAPALRISQPAAASRVAVCRTLVDLLPGTMTALRAGRLDWHRTRLVVDAVVPVAAEAAAAAARAGTDAAGQQAAERETALAVEARVLDRAPDQTPTRLRRALSKAVIAVDPGAAERRRARAVEERRAWFIPSPTRWPN